MPRLGDELEIRGSSRNIPWSDGPQNRRANRGVWSKPFHLYGDVHKPLLPQLLTDLHKQWTLLSCTECRVQPLPVVHP